ncbi:hypothetical protein AALO_G00281940 [Alosa alosa]|uniref:Uncharacterized protein n=1 Tax=Alosa alosa TaxID=278164 RepID=A0AAV6FP94_9TELE|nr:hypothetical protein AALO_G00281940 [Alosa alosa]
MKTNHTNAINVQSVSQANGCYIMTTTSLFLTSEEAGPLKDRERTAYILFYIQKPGQWVLDSDRDVSITSEETLLREGENGPHSVLLKSEADHPTSHPVCPLPALPSSGYKSVSITPMGDPSIKVK